MRRLPLPLLLLGPLTAAAGAQTLVVGSFDASRCFRPLTDSAQYAHGYLQAQLTSGANFGPNGTVPCAVSIAAPTSTISAAYLAGKHVFFTSGIMSNLSAAEQAALGAWHAAGGSIVLQAETISPPTAPASVLAALGTNGQGFSPGSGCNNFSEGARMSNQWSALSAGPFGNIQGQTLATTASFSVNPSNSIDIRASCTSNTLHVVGAIAKGALNGPDSGSILCTGDTLFTDIQMLPSSGYYNPNNRVLILNYFASLCGDPLIGTIACSSPQATNSTGVTGGIGMTGSDVAGGNPLRVVAHDLPEGQFAYFLASQSFGTSLPPGSQGVLCLSGNIARLVNQVGQVSGGQYGVDVDTLDIPANPGVAIQAGETWYFQCWYRDNNPQPTSNFSAAMRLGFL